MTRDGKRISFFEEKPKSHLLKKQTKNISLFFFEFFFFFGIFEKRGSLKQVESHLYVMCRISFRILKNN